ncbi:MAG: LLM class flavin-dependent oxidoreductase [Nitrososphaerota archaeon]|nr:LLM class flavin-dependent oxidoreductase [Nitrososphaerota archaeon]
MQSKNIPCSSSGMIRLGFSLTRSDIESTIRHAKMVEDSNFDFLWMPDHLLAPSIGAQIVDTTVTLSYIGANTKRIKLGPGVTDALRRHPAQIAQAFATLDLYTGGRAVLGIGAGEEMNLSLYNIKNPRPLKRLKEAVEVTKLLWTSSYDNPAYYDGEFFSLKRAFLQVKPVQKPRPAIYIGAMGPKNRELAGRIADGVYTFLSIPETFSEVVTDIERGINAANRKRNEVDISAYIITGLDVDKEKALKSVTRLTKSYLMQEHTTLLKMGYEEPLSAEMGSTQHVTVTPEILKVYPQAVESIPMEAVQRAAVFQGPDAIIERAAQFIKRGATQIAIKDSSPDPSYSLAIFRDKIIPAIKAMQ